MKARLGIFCLAALVALFTACKGKEESPDFREAMQTGLQQILDSAMLAYKSEVPDFPGGIAMKVIHQGNSFLVSSGMGEAVTGKIHFRAASITKTFTATAILLLHQQGKLNVNDLITDTIPGTTEPYIPADPDYDISYKESIKILDLLKHRAGVYDLVNDPVPDSISAPVPYKGYNYVDYQTAIDSLHTFSFDELIQVLSETGLSYFEPGRAYHYSNTGYSILGKIIERVANKTYQNYLMENVVLPMGMTNSSFPVLGNDLELPGPYAPGWVMYGNEVYDFSLSNVSATVAEGNLISCPDDLSLFLSELFAGQGVLNYHTVYSLMMHYLPLSEDLADGYACGLRYMNMLGYGHTGAIAGYLSIMVCDPEMDFTVVAFTNAWNFNQGVPGLEQQVSQLLKNTCYEAKALMRNSAD